MVDGTFNSKIYTKQGGDEQVFASGSTLTLESGSTTADASTKTVTGTQDWTLATLKTPNVANANVIGGIPVIHRITIANGSSADTDVVLTHKTRVIDVTVVKTAAAGGASDTITVKNGATAITDAIDINVADKAVKRAGTIDDAQWEIAAAGTLRVAMVNGAAGGNNTACEVIVTGIRVA